MLSLEVVLLAVSNVDRSLAFYRDQVGFNLDVDYRPTDDFRVVQLTPPGSACSIHLVPAVGGAGGGEFYLVTDNLAAERERLLQCGVPVSACTHKDPAATWAGGFAPGLDPQRRDYASFAEFADVDGNRWVLQERGYRAS